MSKTILIVEDDEAIRTAIVALLKVEGFHADQVANGKEALVYLSSHEDPCLVMTDLMMPEMSGYELISVMKNTDKMMTIPVVVVSAAAAADKPSGVKFIKKPFEIDNLMKYVREFCGEADCRLTAQAMEDKRNKIL